MTLEPHGVPSRQLADSVYGTLRAIAERQMRNERAGHTLTATALVNEAYLRLKEVSPVDDALFYFAAAEAMRRVLVDHARRRGAVKRGGGANLRVVTDVLDLASEEKIDDALILDDLLSRLEEEDEQASRVVRLRFYAGLSVEDTARVMGVSLPTVKRDWAYARAWLLEAWESEGEA